MLLPNDIVHKLGRILLVDDQPMIRTLARHYLNRDGYTNISEAEDGAEAWQQIQAQKPDIILLDVVMPSMDGFQLCEKLKADPEFSQIPILFLTGLNDDDHRTRAYRMGAVDYVNKPIVEGEILARAQVHLHNGMLYQRLQDYHQRVSLEINKARVFQQGLLPRGTDIYALNKQYGLNIQATFKACDELAGDYWQLFPLNENQLGIALADFTGHGVTAALNTAIIHALFLEVEKSLADADALIDQLNNKLHRLLTVDSFATLFYGIYDKTKQELSYVSCGAMPPALWRNDKQKFKYLDSAGVPLGLLETAEMEPTKATIKLTPDTQLLLYSDALIEAKHQNGGRWYEDGLTAVLNAYADLSPSEATLLEHVENEFFKTVAPNMVDDLTLLGIKLA